MTEIYNIFLENFDEVIKKYNLDTEEIDDRTLGININKNQLRIYSGRYGVQAQFFLIEGVKATLFDIGRLLAEKIDEKDRTEEITISKGMKIIARCLDRNFTELLQGDMTWFEEYKRSKNYYRLVVYNNYLTREIDESLNIESFRELNEAKKNIIREKILKLIEEYTEGKFRKVNGMYMTGLPKDKSYYYIERNGSEYSVVDIKKGERINITWKGTLEETLLILLILICCDRDDQKLLSIKKEFKKRNRFKITSDKMTYKKLLELFEEENIKREYFCEEVSEQCYAVIGKGWKLFHIKINQEYNNYEIVFDNAYKMRNLALINSRLREEGIIDELPEELEELYHLTLIG